MCMHAQVNYTARGVRSTPVKRTNTECIELPERDSVNQICERGGALW